VANYHIYLISSLPALNFGAKPPFSFDHYLKACEGLISDEDMSLVRSAESFGFNYTAVENATLKKLAAFETMLRNELVKIRSSRKKIDPAKYLREDGFPESVYAAHMAINAYRKPSLLEAEKALDLDRWAHLEELAVGHYFDIDILIIYARKLLILERWDKISTAQTHTMLEEVLS
jgi:hypothetical protein